MVFLCPRHPWEEMVLAGFLDRLEDFFRVSEVIASYEQAISFELASEGSGGEPGEAGDWKVVL